MLCSIMCLYLQPIRRLLDEKFPDMQRIETKSLHKGVAGARHTFLKQQPGQDKLNLLLQVSLLLSHTDKLQSVIGRSFARKDFVLFCCRTFCILVLHPFCTSSTNTDAQPDYCAAAGAAALVSQYVMTGCSITSCLAASHADGFVLILPNNAQKIVKKHPQYHVYVVTAILYTCASNALTRLLLTCIKALH